MSVLIIDCSCHVTSLELRCVLVRGFRFVLPMKQVMLGVHLEYNGLSESLPTSRHTHRNQTFPGGKVASGGKGHSRQSISRVG
jgi:hypothetical protein